MKEITDLVKEYNPKIVYSNRQLYDVFGLDNGFNILEKYFSKVERSTMMIIWKLIIWMILRIIFYRVMAIRQSIYLKINQAFKNFLDRKLSSHTIFYITKDAGMFICQK